VLSNTFVKDPHSVVKAGQIVKVKVLEVDEKHKRIALTMRLTNTPEQTGGKPDRAPASAPMGGAMAAAFSKLKGEVGLLKGKGQDSEHRGLLPFIVTDAWTCF
jgi:protein Tex